MRHIALVVLLSLAAFRPAAAVIIGADQNAGAIPMEPGTGLLGSYYKFNIGYLTTLNQATQLIAAASGPTATFTTTTVCFPNCNVSTVVDSVTSLSGFLNGNASNLAYNVPVAQIPTAIDHSAMTITGYIAIAQAGSYSFNLGSDDGARLTIGNQIVIDGGSLHSFRVDSGLAEFSTAGLYAINIQYFENSGYTGLELWASDGDGKCFVGRAAGCTGTSSSTALYSSAVSSIAEPGTITIFSIGLAGLAFAARRHAKK